MGVYIKGMQIPGSCNLCPFEFSGDCLLDHDIICTFEPVTRSGDCPLIPVPDHGDLIDSDEYREDFMSMVYSELTDDPDWNRANRIIDAYDMAPTVIPADREGEA